MRVVSAFSVFLLCFISVVDESTMLSERLLDGLVDGVAWSQIHFPP